MGILKQDARNDGKLEILKDQIKNIFCQALWLYGEHEDNTQFDDFIKNGTFKNISKYYNL